MMTWHLGLNQVCYISHFPVSLDSRERESPLYGLDSVISPCRSVFWLPPTLFICMTWLYKVTWPCFKTRPWWHKQRLYKFWKFSFSKMTNRTCVPWQVPRFQVISNPVFGILGGALYFDRIRSNPVTALFSISIQMPHNRFLCRTTVCRRGKR